MLEFDYMEVEIWRDIPGYESLYQVSDLGRIKSLKRKDKLGRIKKETIRKLVKDSRGYLRVGLYKNNKKKLEIVHRLVGLVFIKNFKSKPCINHHDGDKINNRVYNLEWHTHSENTKHAYENGLMDAKRISGEQNLKAKLNKLQVQEIRRTYNNNRYELAKKYSVDESTIRNIITRRTWRHI